MVNTTDNLHLVGWGFTLFFVAFVYKKYNFWPKVWTYFWNKKQKWSINFHVSSQFCWFIHSKMQQQPKLNNIYINNIDFIALVDPLLEDGTRTNPPRQTSLLQGSIFLQTWEKLWMQTVIDSYSYVRSNLLPFIILCIQTWSIEQLFYGNRLHIVSWHVCRDTIFAQAR